MRNRFIVTYDVCDPRRLRKVFKKMKSFGIHIQLSVFECELSARELAVMKTALDRLIKHDEDQVIILDLGPAQGRGLRCTDSLGRPYEPTTRKAIVV